MSTTKTTLQTTTLSLDTTSFYVNGTEPQVAPYLVGVGVGLASATLLLLICILVPVIIYIKCRSSRRRNSPVWRLNSTGTHGKMEDNVQTEQRAALHQYVTMGSAPCVAGQSAVYENFNGGQRPECRNYMVSPIGNEEDLYLQCDAADDAIYINEPACNLAMLPDPHEGEDLYIMPDDL